jgi:hypothetical protein
VHLLSEHKLIESETKRAGKKMTSHASEMPSSPGTIDQYDLYKKAPATNPYEEHRKQLASVNDENLRLKASLTRVQNEYEELRDEANYQRAKVSELQEQVALSKSKPSSFPTNQHTPTATNEYADSTIHNSLIEKSLQNAELTLAHDQLKIELHEAESRLADLELQKRANNKLLLEMGDVIRTLNSVNIEYDTYSASDKKLSSQQQSIRNVKLKVEAMLRNRDQMIKKCRELDELTRAQEAKILLLEAQFHMANTMNFSQGASLAEIADRSIEPALSSAASTLSDDATVSQHSSVSSKQASNEVTDAAASEIVRQSEEIAKYKKQEAEQAKEFASLKQSEKANFFTITRLEANKEQLSTEVVSLKESLGATKGLLDDAVIKRDEFRANLTEVITHYKELQVDHEASNDKIAKLESMVVKLDVMVREAQLKQSKQEEEKAEKTAEVQKAEEKADQDCKMGDLLVAYAKAQKQIESLREALMKNELGENEGKDTMAMFKMIERERDDFQRKFNRAVEETRLAKQQVQKEKEECKRVRRRLKKLQQNRDDETASLESGFDKRSVGSSRHSRPSSHSRSSVHSRSSSRSRSSSLSRVASNKKALVKKASYKPLTVEELMERDFA